MGGDMSTDWSAEQMREGTNGKSKASEPKPAPATGVRKWGPVDILSAPDNRAVARKLIMYVVGVALAPPGAFVAVKRLLPPSRHRDACAAISRKTSVPSPT